MKFISWNVNGLRACIKKGFVESFYALDADFFCLQEIKMRKEQLETELPGYYKYWNSAQKNGYSGTAIFAKHEPQNVFYGIDIEEHDREGRVITAEYDSFYLVTVYTPNSQDGLKRLDYRMSWEDAFYEYLHALNQKKPLIICGDLNVAHNEIDLKHPKANKRNAGFTDEEREKLTCLLDSGFTDTFRLLYPNKKDAYSWWSFRSNARANNTGWRIDYFLCSAALNSRVSDALIYSEIMGSDHCPVGLILY